MDYKAETTCVYDTFPEYFDEKFGEYTNEIIQEELKEVVRLIPPRANILDLGSGPGHHAQFFHQQGLDVLCCDISEEMLRKCREKGLKTMKADIEALQFPEKSFDGVWAYTSLIHLPKKHLPTLLNNIGTILKDDGFFFASFKEGTEEGFMPFEKGGRRFFSLYQDEEIREFLSSYWNVYRFWRTHVPGKNKAFLDYFCRKK